MKCTTNVWVLAMLASLAACKKLPLVVSQEGYILGPTSNIMPVSSGNEAKISPKALHASVLVATQLTGSEVKFCSGTLIAPEKSGEMARILTNHHCFAVPDEKGLATTVLLKQACVQTKVYFGFVKGRTDDSFVSRCQAGSLRTTFDGDLAVFKLTTNLPKLYVPLVVADQELNPDGRSALVVHYPDVDTEMADPPDGGPKLPMAQVTLKSCKVIGAFPIGQWELDRSLPFSLRHTCDIIHGSSGSALVDAQTDQILGVDWGGIKINTGEVTETHNVATRASFVQAFLGYRSKEVEKAAESQLSAEKSEDAQKSNSNVAKKLSAAQKSCGVAAAGSERPLGLVLLLLGAPLLAARPLRRATVVGATATMLLGVSSPLAKPRDDRVSTPEVSVPEVASTPLSPHAAWATTYLLNTAFAAEYQALLAVHAASGQLAAPRARAQFAVAVMRASDQRVPPGLAASFPLKASLPSGADETPAALTAGFPVAGRAAWQKLSAAYALPTPSCALAASATAALTATTTQQTLLATVLSWPEEQVRCFVHALMQSERQDVDAALLIAALQQRVPSLARDLSLQANLATRHLQQGTYPEALRALVALVDLDASFRLPYDLVQRTYAIQQKGGGGVALQGI